MDNYISGYIKIDSNKAWLNGALLFSPDEQLAFPEFIRKLYKQFEMQYSPFYKMDNLSKLGLCASEILLTEEKKKGYDPLQTGVFFQNSSSSLDTDLTYFDTIKDKENYFPSPAVFVYTLPNIVIGEICIRHKIKGENLFLVSEKFDSEILGNYVNGLLDGEQVQFALCGWIELLQNSYQAFLYFVRSGKNNSENTAISAKLHTPENIKQLYTE